MVRTVAVIAGTKVDTAMGAEILNKDSEEYRVLSYPVSQNPQEQTLFQISDEAHREEKVSAIIEDAIGKSADSIFVYCNSLSGTVDFDRISEKYKIPVVTPLNVYTELGRKYNRIGVIAANNQSLAGIEKAVLAGNEKSEVIGISLLPLVKEIEEGLSPDEIVVKWRLNKLSDYFETVGAQALVLGCTHFPYFKEELRAVSNIPVIDPADYMLEALKGGDM